jgi:hypothetical protein
MSLEREGLIGRAAVLETLWSKPSMSSAGILSFEIRSGHGFFAALQLREDVDAPAFIQGLLEDGIILRLLHDNIVVIAPPFTLEDAEISTITRSILNSLEEATEKNPVSARTGSLQLPQAASALISPIPASSTSLSTWGSDDVKDSSNAPRHFHPAPFPHHWGTC